MQQTCTEILVLEVISILRCSGDRISRSVQWKLRAGRPGFDYRHRKGILSLHHRVQTG